MANIKKSEYIRLRRTIIRKLLDLNCFGKGSVYINVLESGIPKNESEKVMIVLNALIKQKICIKKKKTHGWKYFLNMDRYDKLMEIAKEKGRNSVITHLLFL